MDTRKPNRLKEYDYSENGAYFITICTKNRKPNLSKIEPVGAGVLDRPFVKLLPYGVVAERYMNQLNNFYTHLSVDKYVIMPNHIHILLRIIDSGRSRTPAPTNRNSSVAQFVSTFKRFCNKEYGNNIFQRSYYDHVIRGERDYRDVWDYIETNPLRWQEDEYHCEK
ncbi:MAG: transposase [Clostridia bacterium]|nr:transposase [Clostridia bacterium]